MKFYGIQRTKMTQKISPAMASSPLICFMYICICSILFQHSWNGRYHQFLVKISQFQHRLTEKYVRPAEIHLIYQQFQCISWEKHEKIDNIRIDTQKKIENESIEIQRWLHTTFIPKTIDNAFNLTRSIFFSPSQRF